MEEIITQYRELLLQTTLSKRTFNRKIVSLWFFLKFLNLQGANNVNLGILRSVKLKTQVIHFELTRNIKGCEIAWEPVSILLVASQR